LKSFRSCPPRAFQRAESAPATRPSAKIKAARQASLNSFVSPFVLKMHSELLCDAKADVAAKRHGHRAVRVGNVPIHTKPNVQARANSNIGGDSGKQRIGPAAVLSDSGDALVLGINPG